MKYFNIRKLTFRHPCPLGKLKLGKVIGKGSNAIVHSCEIRKKQYLVKRINFKTTNCFMVSSEYDSQIVRNHKINNEIIDIPNVPCRPFSYGYKDHSKDDANKIILSTSYIHEAMIGNLVSEIPFFAKTIAAYSGYRHGNIIMDYAGKPVDFFLDDMDLDDLKSVIQQVMIGLHIAQEKYKFKHHDLHIGNVFLEKIDPSYKFESKYKLNEDIEIQLKTLKYKVCIGDFGFSSATNPETKVRYSRCDFHLNTSGAKYWGKWDANLGNNTGYDILLFLGFLLEEIVIPDHKEYVRKLYMKMKRRTRVSKSHLRPLTMNDSKPLDVLNYIDNN